MVLDVTKRQVLGRRTALGKVLVGKQTARCEGEPKMIWPVHAFQWVRGEGKARGLEEVYLYIQILFSYTIQLKVR